MAFLLIINKYKSKKPKDQALIVLVSDVWYKVLYLALEKRYNFTLDDLDIVANGYQHFQSYLKDEQGTNDPPLNTSQLWNLTILTLTEYARLNGTFQPCFVGEQINIDQIPQYIKEYERGKDLEIWKICYRKTPHSKSVL